MEQKIYDKTALDVSAFMEEFLGSHIKVTLQSASDCHPPWRKSWDVFWKKKIVGVNDSCVVEEMTVPEVMNFLSEQDPKKKYSASAVEMVVCREC